MSSPRDVVVIDRLVLFGATGDLAGRFLLPAVAALRAASALPDDFELVGAAIEAVGDAEFRDNAAKQLEHHAGHIPLEAREAVVRSLAYRQVDVTDSSSVSSAIGPADRAVANYLALPPAVFGPAVEALAAAGMPTGSRLALEKPFGNDLESALALNRLLAETFGDAAEEVVFRVDHVLGMATAQNLLAMRVASPVLEAVWSSAHIERVEILWEETLALEGRAGYYDDGAGALKDVIQNHLLQLLCLTAMELPATVDANDLRDRKVDVLRSIRQPALSRTRRARYTAGRLADPPDGSGVAVPAYVDEEGVDPQRNTETLAELELELDSDRWAGTTFLLRAAKAASRRRKLVIVRFRSAGELSIGIDGPTDITLQITGGTLGTAVPIVLSGPSPSSSLPAYGRVLLDILNGGQRLSVRGDEAELAWRVVTPVLEAWAAGATPLETYPAGSNVGVRSP